MTDHPNPQDVMPYTADELENLRGALRHDCFADDSLCRVTAGRIAQHVISRKLLANIAALLSEIASQQKQIEELTREREWRPIETAPRDGTPILGFNGAAQTVVAWWAPGGGYWNLVACGAYAEDGEWTPTYWQPLPAPPSHK